MRGRAIRDAILDDLVRHRGLAAARRALVGGCSAGGLAVFFHADVIRTRLSAAADVKAYPDAGFFIDGVTVGGVRWQRQLFQYSFKMHNATAGVDASCIASYRRRDRTGGEDWHCLFSPYALPFVETPMFLLQSQYDTWQLLNTFAPTWLDSTPDGWGACLRARGNSTQCTAEMLRQLRDQWLPQMTAALNASGALRGGVSGRGGLFAHSCWMHCQNGVWRHSDGTWGGQWVQLEIGGVALHTAMTQWFNELARPAGGTYIHRDAPWPSNPTCDGMT